MTAENIAIMEKETRKLNDIFKELNLNVNFVYCVSETDANAIDIRISFNNDMTYDIANGIAPEKAIQIMQNVLKIISETHETNISLVDIRERDLLIKKVLDIMEEAYKEYSDDKIIPIFVDYDEHIGDASLREISKADNPTEKFNDILSEWEAEYDWMEYDIKSLMQQKLSSKEYDLFNEYYSDVAEAINENGWYFSYDPKDLDEDICVNIMLDTGNLNYDFTRDNVLNWYGNYGDGSFEEESSILWLARQQGKEEELKNACKEIFDSEGNYVERKTFEDSFVESCVQELENLPSHMATLTFLVKMKLSEYLQIRDMMISEKELNKSYNAEERKGTSKITLQKDTMCGLFDPWQGGGSVLEIELDKDVELPIKYIFAAEIETGKASCFGYSVQDVYGLCKDAWKETLKL